MDDTNPIVYAAKYSVVGSRLIGAILILSGGIMLFLETRYYKEQMVPENGRFDAAYHGYIILLSGYCCLVAGRIIQLVLRLATSTDHLPESKKHDADNIESEGSIKTGWFFFTLIEALLDLTLCVFLGFMVFRYTIDENAVQSDCDSEQAGSGETYDESKCLECKRRIAYKESYNLLSSLTLDNDNPLVKFRNQYMTMFTIAMVLGCIYVVKAFSQIFFLFYLKAIENPVQIVFPLPLTMDFRKILVPFRNHMVVSSILFSAAFLTLAVDLTSGNLQFGRENNKTVTNSLISNLEEKCNPYLENGQIQTQIEVDLKLTDHSTFTSDGFFERDLSKTFFICHTLVMTACILLFVSETAFSTLRIYAFTKETDQHHLAQGSWNYKAPYDESKQPFKFGPGRL